MLDSSIQSRRNTGQVGERLGAGEAEWGSSPGRSLALAIIASVCASIGMVLLALGLAMLQQSLLTSLAFILLAALFAWGSIFLAGCCVVSVRCRVGIAGGVISVISVMPDSRLWPRFRRFQIGLDKIAAIEVAERLAATPWVPEVRRCAWIVTTDHARCVFASCRGEGPGSLPLTRAAVAIAKAAGVEVRPCEPGAFRIVGQYGGAALI